jgi:hypothetical protein
LITASLADVAAFLATTALHHTLTEQRAFGHQRQRRIVEHQTFIKWGDGDRQTILASDEVRPTVDGFRSQFQAFEQTPAAPRDGPQTRR